MDNRLYPRESVPQSTVHSSPAVPHSEPHLGEEQVTLRHLLLQTCRLTIFIETASHGDH